MRAQLIVLGTLFLSGCTSSVMTSQKLEKPQAPMRFAAEQRGQCGRSDASTIYSLPKALVPLTLTYSKTLFRPTPAQAAAIAAQKKIADRWAARLKKAEEDAENPEVIGPIEKRSKVEAGKLNALRQGAQQPGFDATVGVPQVIADPLRTYALCYNGNIFSDDEIEVKTTAAGLLSEVTVSADDRTDDVVRKLAEGLVEVAKLTSVGGLSGTLGFLRKASAEDLNAPRCDTKDYNITLLVDPTDQDGTQGLIESALAGLGLGTLEDEEDGEDGPRTGEGCIDYKELNALLRTPTNGSSTSPLNPLEEADLDNLCSQGACYARTAPVAFNVTETSTGMGANFLAELPNQGPVGVVSFARGTFVKIDAKATFSNGMLTAFSYKKPSSALAVASLPVDILKSIVSIPSAAFETKNGAVEAQAALLSSQAELLSARNALDQFPEVTAVQNEIALLELRQKRRTAEEVLIVTPAEQAALNLQSEIDLLGLRQQRRTAADLLRITPSEQTAIDLQTEIDLLRLQQTRRELLSGAAGPSEAAQSISELETRLKILQLQQQIDALEAAAGN